MKIGIVYLITNNVNNKKYVGVTTLKLNRRWDSHKSDSKRLKYPLYRSIRKYGINNFSIKPIKVIRHKNKNVIIEKLNKLEIKYIKKYKSFIEWNKGGYNLTRGGNISNISENSRKKQSKTMKERYIDNPTLSKEYGNRIKMAYKNKPELRKKLSEAQKCRFRNKEERHKLSQSIKQAYINDPKLREKISKIHKQLNVNRPELGIQHSKRMRGINHPQFDHTIYTFKNLMTGNVFVGTRYDFYTKYNLDKNKISLLVSKQRNHHKKWYIEKD